MGGSVGTGKNSEMLRTEADTLLKEAKETEKLEKEAGANLTTAKTLEKDLKLQLAVDYYTKVAEAYRRLGRENDAGHIWQFIGSNLKDIAYKHLVSARANNYNALEKRASFNDASETYERAAYAYENTIQKNGSNFAQKQDCFELSAIAKTEELIFMINYDGGIYHPENKRGFEPGIIIETSIDAIGKAAKAHSITETENIVSTMNRYLDNRINGLTSARNRISSTAATELEKHCGVKQKLVST